jgi:hypothetical protein
MLTHAHLLKRSLGKRAGILVLFTGYALAAVQARAQEAGIAYEKVLLPLQVYTPRPGAFGSLWVTQLKILNSAAVPVSLYPVDMSDGIICQPCPAPVIAPNITQSLRIQEDRPSRRGVFLNVDQRYIDDVQITLRAQDLSRSAQTFGTALPVVRERNFLNKTQSLIDVPTDSKFRQTLRIYSLDTARDAPVQISLFALSAPNGQPVNDVFLGSMDTELFFDRTVNGGFAPASVEIGDLAAIAPLGSYDRIRIDITPLDAITRIWAFVSITNNETQDVTVIEPIR